MDRAPKDLLLQRLANASYLKLNPGVRSRKEASLRRVLLTTRLWAAVCEQQQMLSLNQEDWFFTAHQEGRLKTTMTTDDLVPTDDWPWLGDSAPSSSSTASPTSTVASVPDPSSSLLSHTSPSPPPLEPVIFSEEEYDSLLLMINSHDFLDHAWQPDASDSACFPPPPSLPPPGPERSQKRKCVPGEDSVALRVKRRHLPSSSASVPSSAAVGSQDATVVAVSLPPPPAATV